jgi:site-specific DNA-adenine methylase
MQNNAKPFVKWVGGKSQLISAIEQTNTFGTILHYTQSAVSLVYIK